MKRLSLFFIPLLFLFLGCEGERGPPGPQGPPGESFIGQTFEFSNVDFSYYPPTNIFSTLITVPSDITVYESDAILVYRLVVQQVNGQSVDTWSQIPQQFYLNNGREIQYVFNHTKFDVELLITGNFNLSTLSPEFTNNQVFRFVVVPSSFSTNTKLDLSTYQSLMKEASKKGIEIKRLSF